MVKIIIVTKNTTIKESNVNFDIDKVYKYAGLRKVSESFGKIHTWNVKNNFVSLFANVNGKAGNENKYEIPPPKDNDLFYGSLVLVYHSDQDLDNDNVLDLTTTEWDEYYNVARAYPNLISLDPSAETRNRMSEAGKNRASPPPETAIKRAETIKRRYPNGIPLSEEIRKKTQLEPRRIQFKFGQRRRTRSHDDTIVKRKTLELDILQVVLQMFWERMQIASYICLSILLHRRCS